MVNEFYKWFYGLSVTDNRLAKKNIIEQFEISTSTFYTWLKKNYKFSKIQKIALNKFSMQLNNTKIFDDDTKTGDRKPKK